MKVLINGTYSTGKTTLANSVAAALENDHGAVVFLDETARHCPFPLNKDQTFLGTQWLIHAQISREIAAARGRNDILVVDRGVPDIFAHYLETCDRLGSPSPEIESLRNYLQLWCATYDIIISTTIKDSIDIIPDGFRVTDKAYRRLLDKYNTKSLSALNCRCIKLPYAIQSDDALLQKLIVETVKF